MPDLSVSKSSSKSLHDSKKPTGRSVHSSHDKHSNLKDNRSPRRRFNRSRSSSSSSSDSSSSSSSSSSSKNNRKKAGIDSTKPKDRSKTQPSDLKPNQTMRKAAPCGNSESTISDNPLKNVSQQLPSRNSNTTDLNEKTFNNSAPSRNQNRETSLRNSKPRKDNMPDGPKESIPQDRKRIIVEKLTKNITTAHIMEIFSIWGKVHEVDLPPDRIHSEFNRGYGFVEYVDAKHAAIAVNSMNGGQIDGQEVRVSFDQQRTYDRRSPVRRHDVMRRRRSRSRSGNMSNFRKTGGLVDKNVRPYDRDRRRDRRDRPYGLSSNAANKPRRARRGSSCSPFASRPSGGRGRSPGTRYRRPSPPNDIPAAKRVRSRTPPKPQRLSAPKTEGVLPKQPNRRKATSRSSSSSSSSSNSSSSSGGSSSSSSASSTSS